MRFHRILQFLAAFLLLAAIYYFMLLRDMDIDTPEVVRYVNTAYMVSSFVSAILFFAIGEIGAYLFDIREALVEEEEDEEEGEEE